MLLLTLPKDQPVLRVDTLTCLQSIWGQNILTARSHLYSLVSGNLPDDEYRELIVSYYKHYAAFANYVDEKYLFEPSDIPLIIRIIKPARDRIAQYDMRLRNTYRKAYLGNHMDYAYLTFKSEARCPRDLGELIAC